MFSLALGSVLPYIAGLLLVTNIYSGASSWIKGKDIETQAQTIEKLQAEKAVLEANELVHLASISKQNEAIEALAVDLNEAAKRWDTRVPTSTVIERWRTKYVDRNVTVEVIKEDCENNKLILDAVRNNGF